MAGDEPRAVEGEAPPLAGDLDRLKKPIRGVLTGDVVFCRCAAAGQSGHKKCQNTPPGTLFGRKEASTTRERGSERRNRGGGSALVRAESTLLTGTVEEDERARERERELCL